MGDVVLQTNNTHHYTGTLLCSLEGNLRIQESRGMSRGVNKNKTTALHSSNSVATLTHSLTHQLTEAQFIFGVATDAAGGLSDAVLTPKTKHYSVGQKNKATRCSVLLRCI